MNPKLRLVLLGCAGAGFLGLLIVGGIVALARFGPKVQDIEVALDAPLSAQRGETFPITAHVRNTAAKRQWLVDLDIDSGYLRGVAIRSATPPWKQSSNPLGTGTSYTFDLPIEPGKELVIELQATAVRSGDFSGDFDFCINSSILFVTQEARIVVSD